jgi:hypothetical protein
MTPAYASELATLALLEAAASTCEALLCSIHDPLSHHPYHPYPVGRSRSATARAGAVVVLCRRLCVALAEYRVAVDRDFSKTERLRRQDKPF